MVSKGQFVGLDWNRITRLHSQVMTGTHEPTNYKCFCLKCEHDLKNKSLQIHSFERLFKVVKSKMAFFFLWYLFSLQRYMYSSFPIMQIWSLMTTTVVQVQWCDTKLRITPPIMK